MKCSLKFVAIATLIAWPVSMAGGQEKSDLPQKVRVQAVVRGQDDASPETRIEVRDGKLIIIDGQGNHQEIDVTGANVLSVTQSSSEEVRDGKTESKAKGKAIIIGRDGKKTEIEFDGPVAMQGLPGGFEGPIRTRIQAQGKPLPNAFQWRTGEAAGPDINMFQVDVSKFFIGVVTQPVEATLSAQLGLDEGAGLVVKTVSPDSPAANADLQEHDILLFADDTQLTGIAGLAKVVDQAGTDSKAMTLTLLRGGKEMRVELSPAKRPHADLKMLAGDLMLPGMDIEGLPGAMHLDLQRLGPGLLLGADAGEQQKAMQQLQEDMHRAAEEMHLQMEQMREQFQQSQEQWKQSGEMMKRQLEELNSLRKKLPDGAGKTESQSSGGGNF